MNINMTCQKVCDLFPVDLGVDLRALQPEITQCKRRFQQDLWNTICSRVLEGQSGWKKDQSKEKSQSDEKAEKTEESGGGGSGEGEGGGETKDEDEAPKDDEEPKPEESGENENNARRRMRGSGGGGGIRNWSNIGQQQQLGRSSRRSRQQMQPASGRGYQAIHRGSGGAGSIPRPQPQLPRPQPPSHHQYGDLNFNRSNQRRYQQQQQQRSVVEDSGRSVGELSQFLRRIRPQEGVLDWRDGGRPSRLQQQPSFICARSYSATSKREILGACCDQHHDDGLMFSGEDEALDYSEAFEGAQVFYGQRASGGGGLSDGETNTTYCINATNGGGGADGATSSTMATREFVPLMVGNWWGGQSSARPQ